MKSIRCWHKRNTQLLPLSKVAPLIQWGARGQMCSVFGDAKHIWLPATQLCWGKSFGKWKWIVFSICFIILQTHLPNWLGVGAKSRVKTTAALHIHIASFKAIGKHSCCPPALTVCVMVGHISVLWLFLIHLCASYCWSVICSRNRCVSIILLAAGGIKTAAICAFIREMTGNEWQDTEHRDSCTQPAIHLFLVLKHALFSGCRRLLDLTRLITLLNMCPHH